jgi:RNA polymerase sigma factor (sigma-70 family)
MTSRRKVFGVEANEQVRTGWHALPEVEEEEEADELCTVDQLHDALKILTTRQRFVIELRYGMRDGHIYSQAEIAEMMGITRQAVMDHEQAGIVRLQKGLADTAPMVNPL